MGPREALFVKLLWPLVLFYSHRHSTPSLGGSPSEYCRIIIAFGIEKTRMVWLPDGEKVRGHSFRQNRRRGTRTSGRTYTARRQAVLMHSITRRKLKVCIRVFAVAERLVGRPSRPVVVLIDIVGCIALQQRLPQLSLQLLQGKETRWQQRLHSVYICSIIDLRETQLSQRSRSMLRVIEYFAKPLKVTQDHWKWHHSIGRTRVPVGVP